MDSAAFHSLTPLLDGIDQWVELVPLLPVIISLELVLSADNAVALASITRKLASEELQLKALNIGITISLFLRLLLIFMAQLVLRFWPIQLAGGLYLIIISAINLKLIIKGSTDISSPKKLVSPTSLFKVVSLLALTDLAFSIDSVTAAVAISDQLLLVSTGAIIGVIALRFTSALFIEWLEIYSRLEYAGYIAVGLIGIKLIIELIFPTLIISEYLVFILMLLIFIWGFSRKK